MTAGRSERPRLLVPVTINFTVRYVVRTGMLDRLRAFCTPVFALTWDDQALVDDLLSVGAEVLRLPDGRLSPALLQTLVDHEAAFEHLRRTPSTSINQSMRQIDLPAKRRARRWTDERRASWRTRRPGSFERAAERIDTLLDTDSNIEETTAFLRDHQIDAVLSITPFTVQEVVVLHAAHRLGLPLCASVLSFDNLTTRPPLPVPFERYLVWNRFNEDEILRSYPGLTADQVEVTGPPQFDFYADPGRLIPEAAWRARLGLTEGARTILYGAGPPSISANEPQYVDHLLTAIGDGRLPGDVKIVLRRHPNDPPQRWERFRQVEGIHFDDPGGLGVDPIRPGQANLRDEQISALCSTLAYTDVHVNVSSTMTLDGAFYDKPQIGPAYDDVGSWRYRRTARDLYRREHFLPIVASGGLELARSQADLVRLVGAALADPGRRTDERRAMLEALCTFLDGRSTERVVAQVEAFLARTAGAARSEGTT